MCMNVLFMLGVMSIMNIHTHMHHTCSSNRGQKKAPDFLELELRVIMNHHDVWAGNQTLVLYKSTQGSSPLSCPSSLNMRVRLNSNQYRMKSNKKGKGREEQHRKKTFAQDIKDEPPYSCSK